MEAFMKVTEEMIRALQAKIDITYEEAERYLYRSKGDVDYAAYMYKEKQNSFSEKFRRGFKNLLKYRIILSNKERILVDVPILSLLLLLIIDEMSQRIVIVAIIVIAALVSECEFKIQKDPLADDAQKTSAKHRNVGEAQKVEPIVTPPPVQQHRVVPQNRPIEHSTQIIVEENQKEPYNNSVNHVTEGEKTNKSQDYDDDYYEFVIED